MTLITTHDAVQVLAYNINSDVPYTNPCPPKSLFSLSCLRGKKELCKYLLVILQFVFIVLCVLPSFGNNYL